MLISNKNYQNNDVITFKLVSGEEVIGRFIEETDIAYSISKPMMLIPTPNQGLGLAPVSFSLNPQEKIMLNKHAVSIHGRTVTDLANQYMEKTTGLTVIKNA